MLVDTDVIIKRFRRLQHDHRVDGGFYRGVSACIRDLIEMGELDNEGGGCDDCGRDN
jgi:hypothetical protein